MRIVLMLVAVPFLALGWTTPGRADVISLAWMNHELENRCVGDDQDREDRVYHRRLLYAARLLGCPGFEPIPDRLALAPMPQTGLDLLDDSPVCTDYIERSWRQMYGLAKINEKATETFCTFVKRRLGRR